MKFRNEVLNKKKSEFKVFQTYLIRAYNTCVIYSLNFFLFSKYAFNFYYTYSIILLIFIRLLRLTPFLIGFKLDKYKYIFYYYYFNLKLLYQNKNGFRKKYKKKQFLFYT